MYIRKPSWLAISPECAMRSGVTLAFWHIVKMRLPKVFSQKRTMSTAALQGKEESIELKLIIVTNSTQLAEKYSINFDIQETITRILKGSHWLWCTKVKKI